MADATAFTETESPLIHAALCQRPMRNESLVSRGLHTDFRVNELLALDVRHGGTAFAGGTCRAAFPEPISRQAAAVMESKPDHA